jgi:hypothetical protein
MSHDDDSLSEFDSLELDDSQEQEDLKNEFTFQMEEDTNNVRSEVDNLDQRFAERFQAILNEVNSGDYEEQPDTNKFFVQFNELAREMDAEYFGSFFKNIGKKLIKHAIPGYSVLQMAKKLAPLAKSGIFNTLKKSALKYGLKYGIRAIPGVGNVASIAGPLLAQAGVPGLKNIFETEQGNDVNISSAAQNFVQVARDALEYMYKNLEIESDDPLKAQELANQSINHALQRLQHRGTTGGFSTSGISPNQVIYVSPGQSITFTLRIIGKQ